MYTIALYSYACGRKGMDNTDNTELRLPGSVVMYLIDILLNEGRIVYLYN